MYFNLIMELERGNKESLKEFLLKAKYSELFDSSNEDGECLTHYAIMHNSEVLLKYLIHELHNLNETDVFGRNSYNFLELYANKDIFDMCLKNGVKETNNLLPEKELLLSSKKKRKLLTDKSSYSIAHKNTHSNMNNLFIKQKCVCIYCEKSFVSDQITQVVNYYPGTALCPYCGIDAVIGEVSGFELNEEFKAKMNMYFFNNDSQSSNHVIDLDLENTLLDDKIIN